MVGRLASRQVGYAAGQREKITTRIAGLEVRRMDL